MSTHNAFVVPVTLEKHPNADALSLVKVCTKCGIETSDFIFKDKTKGIYRSECRKCTNTQKRNHYATHKEWYSDYAKKYALNNPEKMREYYKTSYLNTGVRIREKTNQYKRDNPEKRREINRKWVKKRRDTDINFKLRTTLRNRVNGALKRNQKVGSAVKDLGCSIDHLKLHLRLFWDEGMSWGNYGRKEGQWSIDHIFPLSKVDLTDRSQFLKVNHYTNLQPLWHLDNVSKQDRIYE